MKERILALILACSLAVSMVTPLVAQQDNSAVDEITIPEGTEFKLQLHTTINSQTSKAGDRVVCSLIDPVAVEDRDVLSKGIRVDGHIGEAKEAQRRGRGGLLTIVFDTVELPNGQKVAILGSLTEVFSSESGSDPNVGPEGELKGKGPNRKEQAALIIVPASLGAVGGITGAVGLGAAGILTAIFFPKGKQAALGAGSLVGMRLDRDVNLVIPSAGK
jgi:hypothetical protein